MKCYSFKKFTENTTRDRDQVFDEVVNCLRGIGKGPWAYRWENSRDGTVTKSNDVITTYRYDVPGLLWDSVVEPQKIWGSDESFVAVHVYATGRTDIFGDRVNRRLAKNLKRLGFKRVSGPD